MHRFFQGRGLTAFLGGIRPHTVFLTLALTFGLAVLFANPPCEAPDECDHFYRAFQLSEGTFVGQKFGRTAGGQIPTLIVAVTNCYDIPFHPERKMKRAYFAAKLHPAFVRWDGAIVRQQLDFPHTVIYSPLSYLPQTLAICLGKLLRIGPLGLLYLARLAGFGVSVALGFLALRCLPIYRWTVMLLLLCPMNFYLLGSVAMDGVLITSSFLLIALALRALVDSAHRVTRMEQVLMIALATVISMGKLVYLPLAVGSMLLVSLRLKSASGKWRFLLGYFLVGLLPTFFWNHVMAGLYVPGRYDVAVDAPAQLRAILQAPGAFFALLAKSVIYSYQVTYYWLVGVLGWLDTVLPLWFYSFFKWAILGCLVLESDGARVLRGWHRLTLLAMAAATVVLLYVALYAIWNRVGSQAIIEGVQGRYLLPIAPLVVLCFPALPRFRPPPIYAAVAGLVVGATSAAVCLEAVIARYYLP